MGKVTSTLEMRLQDGVSGPAKKVAQSLHSVNGAAQKVASGGRMVRGKYYAGNIPMPAGVSAAAMLAGGGKIALGAAGAYAGYKVADSVRGSYKEFGDYERRITRILITAEEGAEAAAKTRRAIKDIASDTGLSISDVTGGLETLVAAGRNLPDAMSFLPHIAQTAQAAGASVEDIATTADALGLQFGIRGDQMGEAFDRMAKAGKLGKFELKDMAKYWASISALAKPKGFKGIEGLTELLSIAQIVRQGVGTSEEAFSSLMDMMSKADVGETQKKYGKYGIDLQKEMKAARKAGNNELLVEMKLLEKVIQKGGTISEIYQDRQAKVGWTALFAGIERKAQMAKEIADSAGTVAADVARVSRDAAAASQRLSDSWNEARKSLGNLGDAAGATTFLTGFAAAVNEAADNAARLAQNMREAGAAKGLLEYFRQNDEVQAEKDRRATRDSHDLGLPTFGEQTALDAAIKKIKNYKQMIAQRKNVLAQFENASKGRTLSPEVQAKYQQRLKELQEMEAELAAAERDREQIPRQFQPVIDTPLKRMRADGTAPMHRDGRAPRSIREDYEAGDIRAGVIIDREAAVAAAMMARDAAQAALNARPLTIPVRAGEISYKLGRQVTYGTHGAFADLGGLEGPN